MLEFQQFNTLWDQKFREYDERAAELLDAMRQRHLLDQDEFRKGVEAGPAHRPKASKELLDLRAEAGDGREAGRLRRRAEAQDARRRARGGGGGAPRARGRAARAARRGEVHAAPGAGAQRVAQADPDGRRGAAPRARARPRAAAPAVPERQERARGAADRRAPPAEEGRRRPGRLQSGAGSSASVARRSSAGAIPRRPASAARGATPASRAPGFSAARTPAPPTR